MYEVYVQVIFSFPPPCPSRPSHRYTGDRTSYIHSLFTSPEHRCITCIFRSMGRHSDAAKSQPLHLVPLSQPRHCAQSAIVHWATRSEVTESRWQVHSIATLATTCSNYLLLRVRDPEGVPRLPAQVTCMYDAGLRVLRSLRRDLTKSRWLRTESRTGIPGKKVLELVFTCASTRPALG